MRLPIRQRCNRWLRFGEQKAEYTDRGQFEAKRFGSGGTCFPIDRFRNSDFRFLVDLGLSAWEFDTLRGLVEW